MFLRMAFRKKYLFFCVGCLVVLLCLWRATAHALQTGSATQATSGAADIPAAELLQPAALAQILQSPTAEKPVILQVGSHVLYAEAHIPGSEYVGPGGQASGLQALQSRVQHLGRDQLLVIYCGCCPWTKCPNILPAYRQLIALGFTRVKVLYIADNFGKNWVAQGYPIAKGR